MKVFHYQQFSEFIEEHLFAKDNISFEFPPILPILIKKLYVLQKQLITDPIDEHLFFRSDVDWEHPHILPVIRLERLDRTQEYNELNEMSPITPEPIELVEYAIKNPAPNAAQLPK